VWLGLWLGLGLALTLTIWAAPPLSDPRAQVDGVGRRRREAAAVMLADGGLHLELDHRALHLVRVTVTVGVGVRVNPYPYPYPCPNP
jgi:hypothetical protein